jgi:hypothetical protein
MTKPVSPFAGIKLTEPAPPAPGPDQRLFAPAPLPAKRAPSQATKQATLEPSKVGTLEPRKQGPLESHGAAVAETQVLFDLTEQPYRNDTFTFTDRELDAVEDLKIDLRRQHGIRATKNNLVRCAVHLLVEDYQRNKGESVAARRLRGDAA